MTDRRGMEYEDSCNQIAEIIYTRAKTLLIRDVIADDHYKSLRGDEVEMLCIDAIASFVNRSLLRVSAQLLGTEAILSTPQIRERMPDIGAIAQKLQGALTDTLRPVAITSDQDDAGKTETPIL